MRHLLALILVSLMLSACGLRPLYSGGSQGQVSALLGSVTVDAIEGKNGWLMRNALNDRLGASRGNSARYRLVVKLDDQIEGFGVRADRHPRTAHAARALSVDRSGKQQDFARCDGRVGCGHRRGQFRICDHRR